MNADATVKLQICNNINDYDYDGISNAPPTT